MALEGIAKAAKSLLHGEEASPSADRAEVLQDLHLSEKAWASDDGHAHPWFARDGDRVAFTPTTRNGAPLTIGGLTTTFVPADRFADYLQNMRSAVERGDFDAEIAGALHGSANVSGLADVPVPAARQGTPEQVRQDQQNEAAHQDGRNPDGSLRAIFGHRSDAQ